MRQGIGEVATLNIIIIFILIVFGLLTATVSYYKAFKLNSSILYTIDKFEGYNDLSKREIEGKLNTLGYTKEGGQTCPARGSLNSVSDTSTYYYCVYYIADDTPNRDAKDTGYKYYNYSVVTYIYVDLPVIDKFKIPVYTKGERIYNFTDGQRQR